MVPCYYLFEEYYDGEYIVKHAIKRLYNEIYNKDFLFKYFCKYNMKKYINYCIELDVFNYYLALEGACEGGNLELFNILFKKIKLNKINLNKFLYHSSKGGNIEIINFILEIKEKDIDTKNIVEGSCLGGHFEIFKTYFKEYKNIEYYIELLEYSIKGKNLNIIILLLNKIKENNLEQFININKIVNYTISSENLNLFKFILKNYNINPSCISFFCYKFIFINIMIKHLKGFKEYYKYEVNKYEVYIYRLKLYNKINFKKYSRYMLI